ATVVPTATSRTLPSGNLMAAISASPQPASNEAARRAAGRPIVAGILGRCNRRFQTRRSIARYGEASLATLNLKQAWADVKAAELCRQRRRHPCRPGAME